MPNRIFAVWAAKWATQEPGPCHPDSSGPAPHVGLKQTHLVEGFTINKDLKKHAGPSFRKPHTSKDFISQGHPQLIIKSNLEIVAGNTALKHIVDSSLNA